MRLIGTLPSEEQAKSFADYLVSIDIAGRVEPENEAWTVWVLDEDQLDAARSELDQFKAEPAATRYRAAGRVAADRRKQQQTAAKSAHRNMVNLRDRWSHPSARKAPLTLALLVASTLVSLGSNFGQKVDPLVSGLGFARFANQANRGWGPRETGTNGSEAIRQGEVWRLVTPILIHLSLPHLIFNMYWLFVLGGLIETRRGTLRLALMVLLLAAASNVGQFLVSGPAFGGMSGVGYGLFGYAWMKSRFEPALGINLAPNTVLLFIVWFFICLTGAVGPVANTAHGVGLAGGVLLGYARTGWRRSAR